MQSSSNPTERALRQRHQRVQAQSPYEIFALWEGCGQKRVREAFYQLVKEHHPDRYGGNLSEEVKALAQEHFIAIKRAYAQLQQLEGEETVPEPPRQEDGTSSAPGPSRQEVLERLKARKPSLAHYNLAGLSQASDVIEPATISTRSLMHTEPPLADDAASNPVPQAQRRALLDKLANKRPPAPAAAVAPQTHNPALYATLPGARQATHASSPGLSASLGAGATPPAPAPQPPQGPRDAKSLFNEGFQEFKFRRYDRAIEPLRQAYEADPEDGLYMTFYGYTLFLLDAEKKAEAEKILRKAIEKRHRQALPDAHLFLGYVLKTTSHKREEALRHFRAALQINPSCHEAEREIRLSARRKSEQSDPQDVGNFLRKLFKK